MKTRPGSRVSRVAGAFYELFYIKGMSIILLVIENIEHYDLPIYFVPLFFCFFLFSLLYLYFVIDFTINKYIYTDQEGLSI